MIYNYMPPGWYRDPSGVPGRQRYWNGAMWTEYYQQAYTPPIVPPVPSVYAVPPVPPVRPPQPIYYAPAKPQETGYENYAIVGLVLGVIAISGSVFLFGGISIASIAVVALGILAIVFGSIGVKSAKRGTGIAGIILGGIILLIALSIAAIGASVYDENKYKDKEEDAITVSLSPGADRSFTQTINATKSRA